MGDILVDIDEELKESHREKIIENFGSIENWRVFLDSDPDGVTLELNSESSLSGAEEIKSLVSDVIGE